ncbi:MAG TPA: arabinofuranosyltransferase, partial [Actinomycetales bacterium]|nr:arabinofuranosyltransferase [Actinomycetales bacterium]
MVESTTASTGDPGGGAVTTNAVATPVRGSSARAWPDDQLGEIFADDQLSLRHALIGMVAALVGGAAATLVAWFVLRAMSLPAFGGSFVTRAVSSAAT